MTILLVFVFAFSPEHSAGVRARQTLPLAPMPSPVCAWSARCGGAIWHWVSWCWLQCLWAVHSLPARKRCVAAGRWPVFWLLSVQYVFWPQRVHRSRWAQLPVWAALCGAFWNACAPRGSAPWAAAGSAPTSGKSPLAGCIWPWRAVCCSTGTCCCALWRTAPAGTA